MTAKIYPLSSSGEKVADRPNEGAFVKGSVLKSSLTPSPLTPFFASIRPYNKTFSLRKKIGGEGGKAALSNYACSSSTFQ